MKQPARPRSVLCLALACLFTGTAGTIGAEAAKFFVSPHGSDDAPGSFSRPFATLGKAVEVVQAGDTCYLREGVYREVLRPARSGRIGAPIIFSNWENEPAMITGADLLSDWIEEDKGAYATSMAWSLEDDNQVFADGTMLVEASWPAPGDQPLFQPTRATASSGTETTLVCKNLPGEEDAWKGARLWCAGGAAWICWSSTVTAYDPHAHTLTFEPARETWYTPREGNLFALRGVRQALHAPGQWFYDAKTKRMLVIPPSGRDIRDLNIEAKRRKDAIDLRGRSHIHIEGLHFRAAGIRTDERTAHVILENLHGKYVSHSNTRDVSNDSGVLIFGNNILLLSCDLGFSSSSVVSVKGQDNRIINCHIHHGGYGGLWRGTVALAGRRIVFSHNTVRHAGRDLINTHGLMEGLVQYNDVSEAGWLTKDLGMFYGHNTDFANTEFRYNYVHDNHAAHCAMGIYFDHLSHNAIVRHNVVRNVGMDPIRFNNPSYNNLVYNNTCEATGKVGTFDHSKREDLFASRYFNNIFNRPIDLPTHVALHNNPIIANPAFADPSELDFRLPGLTNSEAGAQPPGRKPWKPGCDLANPPTPLPTYRPPLVDWMNTVRNACFEFGTLEGWEQAGARKATLTPGNGWGNQNGQGEAHGTGTSKYELRLGPGTDGITQTISGLSPNVTYNLSAWLRVSNAGEEAVLGVKGYGGSELRVATNSTEWTRLSLPFTTGSDSREATIFVSKASPSDGHAWCDNFTLPLRPGAE